MLLVVVSDTHINSTVGLSIPTINLDDGGTYHAGRIQHWLWECWKDDWQSIGQLGQEVAIVFNGDLGELDTKRRSNQIITTNKATIQKIVIDTLEPALGVSERVYFVRGTAAHEGKSGWLEEAIAQDVGAKQDHERGTASWWHIRGVIDGIRLDASHHAGMSGLPWNKANAANNLAARIMWHYKVEAGQKPPHLVLRSHNHHYADSGDNYETKVYFTPAFTVITEFGYRIGKENDFADIGMLVFELADGGFELRKHIKHDIPSMRRLWSVQL